MTDRLAEIKATHDSILRLWGTEAETKQYPTKFSYPADDIDWLIAEVERLRPNSERWQYVRNQNGYAENLNVELIFVFGDAADVAVDAARKTR